MTTPDFRANLDCRCSDCGARGSDVTWARLGSSYENGHVIGGSMPSPCGPMVLTKDYDRSQNSIEYRERAEKRFLAVLDRARTRDRHD
jgi:hypothetical protein